MNYPVWELLTAGGGFLIASMAVIHVYVSHLAVGGGLFLIMAEKKAYKTNDPLILEYAKKHTKFFLLLTMVFGGITGVGIWFTISLLNPSATSTLIHTFVFGWATEWVCFAGEIVALFIYFYTFGKINKKQHLQIGWLYFIFAWLSLVLINGIIAFMLTPGHWIEDHTFWSGFLNPSMLPAMFFRTFLGFMFAGIFGFLTSMFIPEEKSRLSMNRFCASWILVPFAFMLISGYWYFISLPDPIQTMILKRSPELLPYLKIFFISASGLFVGAILLALSGISLPVKKILACIVLVIGLIYMGGFEFTREGGRKPYAIYNHTYANSILKSDMEKINKQGFLKTARWVQNKEITPLTKFAAGKEIFKIQCSSCHSVGGPMNNILKRTKKFTIFGMDSMLNGLGKINDYMPPFMGTLQERNALATYIVTGLQNKKITADKTLVPPEKSLEMPPFNKSKDEYVLLSWNDLGMHCISDSSAFWVLLPPANDLCAQVIKRGPVPKVITKDIKITYKVEKGFENPSAHIKLWDNAQSIFGRKLEPNIGLSGNGLSGQMHLSKELNTFEASLIPVVPYPDKGGFDPYPVFTIEAFDTKTGKRIAMTKTITPTSTEMGCKNCHGGKWRIDGKVGFTDETASDILRVHDKNTGTNLLEMAKKGQPKLCQSCHSDPILKTKGKPDLLNFPAAMHGWHANFLTGRGVNACFQCHPSKPGGPTKCLRGIHSNSLDCTSCHGFLEDHALSLLKKEMENKKPGAKRLMKHLTPRKVKNLCDINPRTPWINEPDCLSCHKNFKKSDPKTADGFNKWTKGEKDLYRMTLDGTGKIMCEACHGSPHANYPGDNKFNKNLDNIQPLQYQNNPKAIGTKTCNLCHKVKMNKKPKHHLQITQGLEK